MIKFDWFLWISHSTLFTACADQLLHNLILIMYSMCKTKQAVKTAIDACSLLTKYTFSNLVGKRAISLIINFQQVIKPILVWHICFTSFWSVVDRTFYESTIKNNCILLLCHALVRSSRQEVFRKKGVLRNFTKFTGKHQWQSLFFNKVAGLLFLQNTSSSCLWGFRANVHSIVLKRLAQNRRNIWILSEQ